MTCELRPPHELQGHAAFGSYSRNRNSKRVRRSTNTGGGGVQFISELQSSPCMQRLADQIITSVPRKRSRSSGCLLVSCNRALVCGLDRNSVPREHLRSAIVGIGPRMTDSMLCRAEDTSDSEAEATGRKMHIRRPTLCSSSPSFPSFFIRSW
ncbi:hypothetical protein L226DRAFT_35835 [Lentinus tigrinus ALCF2SS1-7]|uniref:uncharacterized protein n=1 Tax=Lentinus tigrinus ALCF2SS1-7 TaxID=1328758 RepID=UPI001165F4EC|nr:hypothetical protein L226DRAFT_35835 [Lentinus tigrinus ALCF2SS1-7]